MLKPSICNHFARPLTTLLAHFWGKLIFFLAVLRPLRDRLRWLGAKQQEKIYFAQKRASKVVKERSK